MLNDWNTMENANLIEKKLLKRVDELPIGTVIYGLNHDDNEVTLWVVDERVGDAIYLYSPQAYIERASIVKTDDGKEFQFKDTDVCKAREYFKDKTYKHVDIQSGKTTALDMPNRSRFDFNVYPTSKKSYEVKIEIIDTRHWVNRIHYKTYVLPVFNSEIEPYYPNVKNFQQIAKNVYSQLKYRFKNPNEYEICNYLIESKDSHEDKLKMLDKLQHLPTYNYNVTDIRYNKNSDELTVRIDNTKIDLNSNCDVLDETVRLLDLQECHHCKCDSCKYYNGRTCIKNVQVLRDKTPCSLYSPNKLYKIFEKEWNETSTEAKQGYLDFVRKYLKNKRVIISKVSKEDNVTYFADGTVFDREPDEVVKAKYKQTYYPRRKKNKIVIEEL
jgi:hypothetical protein